MTALIDRYLLRELLSPFLLGLGVFTFVLLMDRILRLTELVITKGVALTDVLRLLVYILPSFFAITVPMAVLVAVLIAFGRLSSDSEITALKANGVGLVRLLPPVMGFCFAGFLVTLLIMLVLLPWGNQSFKTLMYRIVKSRAMVGIQAGVFNDTFDGLVLYASRITGGTTLSGVFISNERNPNNPHFIIAQRGRLMTDPSSLRIILRLYDGSIHRRGSDGETYPLIFFETNDLQLDILQSLSTGGKIPKGRREKTLSELLAEASRIQQRGGNPSPLWVEIHKKFSIPVACLVFGLVGIPLGIRSRRSGRSAGFAIAIGVILVYYVFITAGEKLAVDRRLSPALAMWTPNLLLAAAGMFLFRAVNREMPLPLSRGVAAVAAFVRRQVQALAGRHP